MKAIKNHKVITCDCDDTLILWDKSEYVSQPKVVISYAGYNSEVVIHQKNRNLLIKLAKLGYSIVVWSATGYDWAIEVVKALQLEDYVTLCLTKPSYYLDDKEATTWIGERLWREPK